MADILIAGMMFIIVTIALWLAYLADKGIVSKWLDGLIEEAIKKTSNNNEDEDK